MNSTHGLKNHPLYNRWKELNRSRNRHQLCKEWQDNAVGFISDLEESYKPGLRLLRHDTSKPFSKDNCYFGDIKDQNGNKINKVYLDNGERLLDVCKKHRLNYKEARSCLIDLHWPLDITIENLNHRGRVY